jgi:hypothetical protein
MGNEVERFVQVYWNVGQAWRRGVDAELWTYGSVIDALRPLTFLVSPNTKRTAFLSEQLMQDVVNDNTVSDIYLDAQIIQFPLPFVIIDEASELPLSQMTQ